MATVAEATTINPRLRYVQSRNAPMGARASTVATPAIIMTIPILPASQCWVANR